MRQTTLAYFLMLLVAFATLDNACAAITPDTSDDAAAAENDEYLPGPCRPDKKASAPSDLPTPLPLMNWAGEGPCTAAARGIPADSRRGPLAGLSPLYVFMSLQR
jgi:hypothetical protein